MADFIYREGKYEPWAEAPQLPDLPEEWEGDLAEELGYVHVGNFGLGGDIAGFSVEVNERDDEKPEGPFEFMVEVVLGVELRFVWVPDFPNLLRLLGELAPIAMAATMNGQERQRGEEGGRVVMFRTGTAAPV